MAEASSPDRRPSDRIIDKWTSIETSVYLVAPEMIDALKDSARLGLESLDELAALNKQQAARERKLTREMQEFRVESTRTLGEKDIEIARLQRDLAAAQAQLREIAQHATTAFIFSCLVLALIAIGVNILTGDENQVLGATLLGIGLLLQVATFFVTKRVKDVS